MDTPDIKTHNRWLHEGMMPVWKVECMKCNRTYMINQFQSFQCDCLNSVIIADQGVVKDETPA